MGYRSKKYREAAEQGTREALGLEDAVKKVKSFNTAKFDQTIEVVVQLGIDPKKADQRVRGAMSLPHGIGKAKRVIVFCDDSEAEAAKQAGAVEAGSDDLIKKVSDGWTDFDVAVASPKVMGKVGKLGRILGPQGKMPTPKNGTVTTEVAQAVSEFAAGKVEFRNDAGGNVHVVVGKQSFEPDKLVENIQALLGQLQKMRPSAAKGTYIKQICLSATMSPSVRVAV